MADKEGSKGGGARSAGGATYTIARWVVWAVGFLVVALIVLVIVLPLTVVKTETKTETKTDTIWVPGPLIPAADPLSSDMDPFTKSFAPVSDPLHGPLPGGRTAEQVFASLSFDQKIGQISQFSEGDATEEQWIEMIKNGQVGSLLNVNDKDRLARYQQAAKDANQIPILVGYDIIHGYRTIFPVNLGMAASFDRQMHFDYAAIAAEEGLYDGIRWTFAPMLDIARDLRWGRISESSGEDPYLTGELGARLVKGYQSKGVAACIKHFAAYGAAQAGRDYSTAQLGTAYLHNDYLHAYRKAAEAGALTVMASFNTIDGVPAHANRQLLTDVLRGIWEWEGLLVSDYGGIRELGDHRVAGNGFDATILALTAGVDMAMADWYYTTYLNDTVGSEIQKHIDVAVKRVLKVKEALGLLDNDYSIPGDWNRWDNWLLPASLKAAQTAAENSMVLLKNDGILPLDRAGKKILLIGDLSNKAEHQHGSWAGQGQWTKLNDSNWFGTITYKSAIETMMGDVNGSRVEYAQGYNSTWLMDAFNLGVAQLAVDSVIEAAKTPDDYQAIVIFAGEAQNQNGESASRTHMELPGVQRQLVRDVKAAASTIPLVLCINAGRPQIIEWEDQNFDAILLTWAAGTMGGPAAANVLFGDVNPSGKMPVTTPRNEGQIPIYYSQLNTGRPRPLPDTDFSNWDGRRPFSSLYIDSYTHPLYWFGYGLSYSTFTYGTPTVSPGLSLPLGSSTVLTVTVPVTMTGTLNGMAGTEIVQLYVRDLVASVSPPQKRLRGFERVIFTTTGVPQNVQFNLTLEEDFGFYDNSLNWVVEPGDFEIIVASDSSVLNELRKVVFTVTP